jgi:hypothetical protein
MIKRRSKHKVGLSIVSLEWWITLSSLIHTVLLSEYSRRKKCSREAEPLRSRSDVGQSGKLITTQETATALTPEEKEPNGRCRNTYRISSEHDRTFDQNAPLRGNELSAIESPRRQWRAARSSKTFLNACKSASLTSETAQ